MAQADSHSTTPTAVSRLLEMHLTPQPAAELVPTVGHENADPVFGAIEDHKRELNRRNQTIEAICAAEERCKEEERETWRRYEEASVTLLSATPTTMAGVIAVLSYVGTPECSGPGACETILDGARLSSNREAAAAAERFPASSAQVLRKISGGK
jgi:hypothetical protein